MVQIQVNLLAVLLAAVASMVIGALWYGPLFGKAWVRLSKMSDADMAAAKAQGMGKSYALMFLGVLLMAFVHAHFVVVWDARTVAAGAASGFWVWLGYLVTTQVGGVLWERKPWSLYLLNIGYYLVALLAMGIILALWR